MLSSHLLPRLDANNRNAVIVSLDKMAYTYVDSSTGVATIGGGTRLGSVALGLWQGGQRAMPVSDKKSPSSRI